MPWESTRSEEVSARLVAGETLQWVKNRRPTLRHVLNRSFWNLRAFEIPRQVMSGGMSMDWDREARTEGGASCGSIKQAPSPRMATIKKDNKK